MLLTAGDPRRRTGGNLYDARVVRSARRAGIRVRVVRGATAGARRAIASARPAVIVVDSIAFPLAAACRAAPGARVVALAHMSTPAAQARAVLRRADAAVAVSDTLARELRALGGRRVQVIRPGADGVPRARRIASGGALRVLCVANWSEVKGIDLAVDACARVSGVRLVLAGDEGRGAYRRLVRSRMRGRLVASHGPIGPRALGRLYARSDVVVVPSRAEGFGIVAAEALRHGLPVIASDLPSLRAVVGRAGALVRPGDVSALARAIATGRDPAVRRRWARAARARARRMPRWRDTERAFVSLLVGEMHASTAGGERMPPRGVKSPKRKRQYEKIKKSELKRGRSAKTAKRIAAATTNKTRRKKGETKSSRSRKKS